MKCLVIDTDPGVDDALAILLASAHPNVSIEAVTTVSGNVSLTNTTANALKILQAAEVNVPVFEGCAGALVLRDIQDASYVHGVDGLGDCGIPDAMQKPEKEHAVHALIRLAKMYPGELTLVAIGPLTNLALAVRLDPTLPQKYKELIIMGGAIYAKGNTSNLTAEFNIYSDPEAAAIVFSSWQTFTLSSWETTMAHPISEQTVKLMQTLDTTRAAFYSKISAKTAKFVREVFGRKELFAADSLAMAAAVEPEIVTKTKRCFVDVELAGKSTRGQIVVDWLGMSKKAANANIILEVNYERFNELLIAALQ